MVKILSILLLILFATITNYAQVINVKVSTDSSRYEVGDYINLTYTITHDKDISIYFPSIKDSIKKLELIESLPIQLKDDGAKKESIFKFILAGFDSGSVTIPAITIQYKSNKDTVLQGIKTDSLTLLIQTLPVDAGADIMDIKAPLTIGIDWLFVLLITAIVIVITVIGYMIYKKYFANRVNQIEIKEEIIKLPHEEALELLKDLEEKKLWQSGKIKEYHSEITAIVRRYFERRFTILALEMPTSEILSKLNKINDARTIVDLTENFLQNADMVKFAKFMPLNDVNFEMMNQAYTIVENTKEEFSNETASEENTNV
ncbi:MAG: BatD family protein [Ignavibacteria bacterium]|jgi:hypothetical protein|nr:BatD family protein [Ignavibacteria bacterium]